MTEIDLFEHGILEAHAGTGKTYTIIGLVLRLLRERRLNLSEILIVTYTEKAAGELVDRIRTRIVAAIAEEDDPAVREHLSQSLNEIGEAHIGTIHAMCLRLLRNWPFESGTPFQAELVDDATGLEACLRETLRQGAWRPDGAPTDLFAAALAAKRIGSHFEKALALAGQLLDPAVVLEPEGVEELWREGRLEACGSGAAEACFQARWARAAAALWSRRKQERGLLSYQDMLGRMAEAVGREPFRGLLRRKFRVGLIDEFQDTSALQWSIFRTWFLSDDELARDRATRPVLYLVGDPKQSIYSFQGADVRTYLRACEELAERGARQVSLVENWRSAPELIDGYNALLAPGAAGPWFLDPHPRLAYGPSNQAQPPRRAGRAPDIGDPLGGACVRIAPFLGPAGAARAQYAEACAAWIAALHGREVPVPDGGKWDQVRLDWGDFAIVVGARTLVPTFRRAFERAGIPWALYKQEGVFASRVALETRAVLSGIAAPVHQAGTRRKALATRVLDGREELLDEARSLALRGSWARLWRHLGVRTRVQERLLGGRDGEREWMDLRQVAAHCLEYLVAGEGGLPELVEHLRRLATGEETAREDRNLHARATDRGRVQILTMHASKGLEFPVVFLADTAGGSVFSVHSWIDAGEDGVPRLHGMPSITTPSAKRDKSDWHRLADALKQKSTLARSQEKRRLHYVALTRPKALLVVPCFAKVYNAGPKPSDPLSEAIHAASIAPPPGVALLGAPPPRAARNGPAEAGHAAAPVHPVAEVEALGILPRVRLHTSYSQIHRESAGHLAVDGRLARAEEDHPRGPREASARPDAWLPSGAATGEALHEILEGWLSPGESLAWLDDPAERAARARNVATILGLHGLPRAIAPKVVDLLVRVLEEPVPLPDGGAPRLRDLASDDRRPEVEFHWAFDADGGPLPPDTGIAAPTIQPAGWMVGYIDLLFRYDRKWYVLDWKTTTLDAWTPESVATSMDRDGYLLQARIYGRTVARALPSGEEYGGAIYAYLRAFADPATASAGFWTTLPDPTEPPALAHWVRRRRVKA